MAFPRDEARRLRTLVLRHAQTMLRTRRHTDDLQQQSEWLRLALGSIGDALISIDADGRVSSLNDAAQSLTRWTQTQALRHPLPNVFQILHEQTRREAGSPALQALRTGAPVERATHILVARDGTEHPIDDSAVPICSADGHVVGSVLIFRDVTTRYRAERALRDSEERLRLATSAAQLGIWVWHVGDDRITWDEQWAHEIFKLPWASMPGHMSRLKTGFIHADDRLLLDAALTATVETDADLHFVGRFHRADGAMRWLELTGRPQRTSGERDTIVGTVADVTDREQAQEQVRRRAEANAKFRAIFDQGAHFASLLTTEGVVVDVNRLSVEACGFERSDVVGRRFWECGWWNRSPAVMDLVRSACASAARGDLFRAETPYFLADGTGRQMLLTITPVTDDEGRTLFLSPIGTDTTERRATQDALEASVTERLGAEQALRHSQAESERQRRVYEAILTNTPDLAYVFDLNHRFIYANEVLLTMWGRTWAEALGKTCLELGYEPWHAARHDREIDQVVATRQPVRGEAPFTGTFGRRVYEYIFVPVLGAGGEVEAVAGTTRDVTERKKAEADREALLASERAAREDAERASLVKEEFLAMLSHELRTPLNAIVGWTQVLRRETPTPQTLDQGLAVIDRNARMQAQLIADLLDMSLIMSGKMRIDPERVELRVVVESALESIRASAEAKKITVESVLSPIAAVVNGDPMRLQQVVWNLLSNAIKFTPVGGHVRVTLSQVESHVEIAVRDTGKGIGPDFLPHVFERFRQAETSTAREHRGLGLGLAIVKKLIDVHGGRVQVDSDGEGTGSTFTVHLPTARSQGTHNLRGDHSPAMQDLHVQYDPPDLGGVTVLAVDDDPDARDLIGRLLRECGARVLLAGSTSEALTAMEHERLDVIVSDIAMPVRDGYAFITAVRRMGIRTPAVALSAFARTEDRRRSLQAGFQTHVSKPVEPAELVAIVAALAHKAVAATHNGNG